MAREMNLGRSCFEALASDPVARASMNEDFMREIAEDVAASVARGGAPVAGDVRRVLEGWMYPDSCIDRAVAEVVRAIAR